MGHKTKLKLVSLFFLLGLLSLGYGLSPDLQGPVRPGLIQFCRVAISPDGAWAAWIQQEPNGAEEGTFCSAVYLQELKQEGASPRLLARNQRGLWGDDSIAWAPDSQQLAFFSNAAGSTQLYVAGVKEEAARPLTHLTGYLAKAEWSPDGKSIALLFIENAPRIPGPTMPFLRETGVVGSISMRSAWGLSISKAANFV